jgi:hypothetical protein
LAGLARLETNSLAAEAKAGLSDETQSEAAVALHILPN